MFIIDPSITTESFNAVSSPPSIAECPVLGTTLISLSFANVRTSDVTETTAKVAWDEASDNVGVVGYNVYVNETKVNDELVTGTEYDLTGLTEETEYTVNVTAVDAEGNESVRSEAVTFTTLKTEEPADTEAPTVPANVKASEITYTKATIAWEASTDNVEVAGYNLSTQFYIV